MPSRDLAYIGTTVARYASIIVGQGESTNLVESLVTSKIHRQNL